MATARETGVDVVVRGKDQASGPLDAVHKALVRLRKENKPLAQSLSIVGGVLGGFGVGSVISSVGAITAGIGDWIDRVKAVNQGGRVLYATVSQTALAYYRTVPVLRQWADYNEIATAALFRGGAGMFQNLQIQRALDEATRSQRDAIEAMVPALEAMATAQSDRADTAAREADILRQIAAAGVENEAAIRREAAARFAIEDALARQLEAQKRLDETLAEQRQKLAEIGATKEAFEEFDLRAAQQQKKLADEQERELENLRQRLALEQELERQREEAARKRDEERARQEEERRLEQERQALEREAEQIRDRTRTPQEQADEERKRLQELRDKGLIDEDTLKRALDQIEERLQQGARRIRDAARGMADQLPEAEGGRFLQFRAAAFRDARAREQENPARAVQQGFQHLFPLLRDVLKQLHDLKRNKPEPVYI